MERNPFFDNARTFLIFLVVFGHILQPFTTDSNILNSIYTWVYTFHMPGFIFLAGFFAKGSGDKQYVWKLFKKLIIPYFIFQIIYTGYYFVIGQSDWFSGLFTPQWALWFLVSLFSWHMLLIVFKKIPIQWSLPLAVLIGIMAGYVGEIGAVLSASRTLVFFPFFLAGYFLTANQVMLVKNNFVKIGAVIFMIALFIAMYSTNMPDLHSDWLLSSKSYANLDKGIEGGIIRFIVYAISTLMVISVLSFIPTRYINWVTDIGTQTLYVYLLHGFIVQFLRQFDLLSINHWYDFLFIIILSAVIVLILSSKFIIAITQPLVELRTKKLRGMLG